MQKKRTTHKTNIMSEEPRSKIALVTGITGQDESYLTELLLEMGYTVSKR